MRRHDSPEHIVHTHGEAVRKFGEVPTHSEVNGEIYYRLQS